MKLIRAFLPKIMARALFFKFWNRAGETAPLSPPLVTRLHFQIWYEEVSSNNRSCALLISFSSVSFNGSQNLKLLNFEILIPQLCQLPSDNAFVFGLSNCRYDYVRTIHKLRTLKQVNFVTPAFPFVCTLANNGVTKTIDIHFWTEPSSSLIVRNLWMPDTYISKRPLDSAYYISWSPA